MSLSEYRMCLDGELIVDNFAGGGGASTGIEAALLRHADIAINHDAEAVLMHKVNHPLTEHFCEDVFAVDPVAVTRGRPVGLAWFSPDCKHFSKAKGGKPRSKKIRGLAWVILKWAVLKRPRVIMMENVEEFQDWGPLREDGSPCPVLKGRTFLAFAAALTTGLEPGHPDIPEILEALGADFPMEPLFEGLGYSLELRELRAYEYGAPTIRKRLFVILRRDGRKLVWPGVTHGKPGSAEVLRGERLRWRTAAECIDWSIPCPSIFGRKKPLAEATLRRIARGIRKFVIEAAEPFIVKVNHTSAGYDQFRGQDIQEPLQTVTGRHGFAVAVPHVTKFRSGSTGTGMDEPLHTITAGPKDSPAGAPHAMGLVNAHLAPFVTEHANASSSRNMPADEPLRTQCAQVKGGHFAAVSATLIQTGYGEREGQAPRAPGLDKPLGTVVAGGQKHAAVAAFLAKHYGGNETPGTDLRRPADTVTATDHHALVCAQVVGCGGRAGQSRPRDVSEPVQTMTAKADSCVVTSHISKLYGTTTGHDLREPLHTVAGTGQHLAEVRAFLIKYYTEGGTSQDCREPMHTIPTHDRIGVVTIHGEDYVITDIGMRMLEPRELYRAQGFPERYVIDPEVEVKRGRKTVKRRLPKHAQVRMCGNSVCPPVAEALVRANVPELGAWNRTERRAKR